MSITDETGWAEVERRAKRFETSPRRIVRLKDSPIPLVGLVVGEDLTIHGMPAWIVRVYGYSLKTEAWLKSGCHEPTATIPSYIDIDGWISLAKKNEKPI